jgi:transcriptional regulator with XRE-family HTH domain
VCIYGAPVKPEPIYREIGGMIRALRRRADKAQEALATELGISRATLANIETGRQRILVHQIYHIARALDVKLTDILPPPRDEGTGANWNRLNFEGDLNPEQKKQVANLIDMIDTPTPRQTGEIDGKEPARRRNTRSQSTKASR